MQGNAFANFKYIVFHYCKSKFSVFCHCSAVKHLRSIIALPQVAMGIQSNVLTQCFLYFQIIAPIQNLWLFESWRNFRSFVHEQTKTVSNLLLCLAMLSSIAFDKHFCDGKIWSSHNCTVRKQKALLQVSNMNPADACTQIFLFYNRTKVSNVSDCVKLAFGNLLHTSKPVHSLWHSGKKVQNWDKLKITFLYLNLQLRGWRKQVITHSHKFKKIVITLA